MVWLIIIWSFRAMRCICMTVSATPQSVWVTQLRRSSRSATYWWAITTRSQCGRAVCSTTSCVEKQRCCYMMNWAKLQAWAFMWYNFFLLYLCRQLLILTYAIFQGQTMPHLSQVNQRTQQRWWSQCCSCCWWVCVEAWWCFTSDTVGYSTASPLSLTATTTLVWALPFSPQEMSWVRPVFKICFQYTSVI